MACPMNKKSSPHEKSSMLYGDYLMLDKILSAQRMLSAEVNGRSPAHDEHLFIITHQTYELWFKQIIYELDLVCDLFNNVKTLNHGEVIKRLNRIVMILKVLVEQIMILETMRSMDFIAFRDLLDTASGFQSVQFRVIENKLGMQLEHRNIKFNQAYRKVFSNDQKSMNEINKSLNSPTLLQQIENWLEQTPHLQHLWAHYKTAIEANILNETNATNESLPNGNDDSNQSQSDKTNDTAIKKMREQYATIFDLQLHDALVKRGDRKLSLQALQGAIIISLYKDDAFFTTSHQILMLLVDIDSMLCRWRCFRVSINLKFIEIADNHVLMVQRMIGSMQAGTGGSSGYQYLRSTLSDRYKPFVDLSNVSTFLISKKHLAPLKHLLHSRDNYFCKMPIAHPLTLCSCKCIRNQNGVHEIDERNNCCNQSNSTKRVSNSNGKTCNEEFNDEKAKKYNRHACEDCVMEHSAIPVSKCEVANFNCTSSEDEKKELESSYESASSYSSYSSS